MAKPSFEHCEQLRTWLADYPLTEAEDAALQANEQTSEPTPELVRAVLETHPLEMPSTRRAVRFAAVEPEAWSQTRQRLLESLASEDDVVALVNLTADGGAEGFGISAASLVLSAFQPERFVPFHVPARRALEELGSLPPVEGKGLSSGQW